MKSKLPTRKGNPIAHMSGSMYADGQTHFISPGKLSSKSYHSEQMVLWLHKKKRKDDRVAIKMKVLLEY